MARRRSDNPMTILVLGILSIAFFGVVLVYFSRKTPILQLKPMVEQEFGIDKIKARFLRGGAGGANPGIMIELPAETAADEAKLLQIARFSLKRYGEIAKRTRVDRCTVRVKDGAELTLGLALLNRLEMAEQSIGPFTGRVAELGLKDAVVELDGIALTGTRVNIRGASRTKVTAARLADRIVKLVAKQPYVGIVTVEVKTPEGAVKRMGGRDVPRPPRRSRRPRPKRTPPTGTPNKTAAPPVKTEAASETKTP